MYWKYINYISFNIYIRLFVPLEISLNTYSRHVSKPPYTTLFFFLITTNFPIVLSAPSSCKLAQIPFILENKSSSHVIHYLCINLLPIQTFEKSGIFLVNCPLHPIFVSESSRLWFQYLPFHWNYLQLKLHNFLNCKVQWKLSILLLAYQLSDLVLLNAPLP